MDDVQNLVGTYGLLINITNPTLKNGPVYAENSMHNTVSLFIWAITTLVD